MDQFTRRLVGFGVHRGPVDAPSLCRMCNAAIHGRGAPRHLSTDHDPLFEAHRWTANLRLLEIDEIKTVPHVPLSHPFVERLIGTMRRECLDHVLFWNAGDLERKLADFQAYYNAARSHASLEGYTPLDFAGERTAARAEFNHVRWISHSSTDRCAVRPCSSRADTTALARRRPRPPVANDRLRYIRIGSARVSKADGSQSLDVQRDALRAAGIDDAAHRDHATSRPAYATTGRDSTAGCAP